MVHKRPPQKQGRDFGETPHKTRQGPCLPPTYQASIYCFLQKMWKLEQHSLAEMQLNWPGFLSISLVSAMPKEQEDHTDFATWQSGNPKGCSRSPPRNVFTSLQRSKLTGFPPCCAEANGDCRLDISSPLFRFWSKSKAL